MGRFRHSSSLSPLRDMPFGKSQACARSPLRRVWIWVTSHRSTV